MITAAHCIAQAEDVSVYVGEVVRANIKTGNAIKAKNIVPHENYIKNSKTSNFDIGLIQLETEIKISFRVKYAQLPSQYSPDGTKVTMVGWGRIKSNQQATNLMYGFMEVKNYCRKKGVVDPKSVFCVVGLSAPCIGDSGGPSFIKGTDIIVGVHSQGHVNKSTGECLLGHDYQDESVQHYLNWIQKKIK